MLGTGLAEGTDSVVGVQTFLDVPANATTTGKIFPVTYDDPSDDAEQSNESQLTDFIGQEYILDSLLGHWFVARRSQGTPGNSPHDSKATLVTAGFFVARSTDDDAQTTDSQPIGADGLGQIRANYSPLSANTVREPWIWRRAWILGTPTVKDVSSGGDLTITYGSGTNPTQAYGQFYSDSFPASNVAYGSVSDGPRVQTKTRRRVRQDERLWGIITCCNWPLDQTLVGTNQVEICSYVQVRAIGRLVKSHNRSAF